MIVELREIAAQKRATAERLAQNAVELEAAAERIARARKGTKADE
jgi:hypothetical protein